MADLRRVSQEGETCPPELAMAWGRYQRFYNEYGAHRDQR